MKWHKFAASWDVPTVQVILETTHGSRSYSCIVDTGASYTLLPLAGAESWFGRRLEQKELKRVGGNAVDAQGKPLMGVDATADLILSGLPRVKNAKVWVVANLQWALLGSSDFFHRHRLV